jgi:hypothetical protein
MRCPADPADRRSTAEEIKQGAVVCIDKRHVHQLPQQVGGSTFGQGP